MGRFYTRLFKSPTYEDYTKSIIHLRTATCILGYDAAFVDFTRFADYPHINEVSLLFRFFNNNNNNNDNNLLNDLRRP